MLIFEFRSSPVTAFFASVIAFLAPQSVIEKIIVFRIIVFAMKGYMSFVTNCSVDINVS